MTSSATPTATTVDPAEVERFSALAAEWWNPEGKFAVLHRFNPVRIAYIREQATARLGRDPLTRCPLEGLDLLDIGCGGGLICEPMTRLGAHVTGIDPSEKNIRTAAVHAEETGLDIDYRAITAEALAETGARFDIVLNMEVIEHVADPALFLQTCARLLRPGGIMVLATINRTLKAFGLAIVGAEYILGWLPRGTHQWEKFITPDELRQELSNSGMSIADLTGVVYNPLANKWRRSPDTAVNYMLVAARPAD